MPATAYFILADHGKLGRSWVERDANETDLETTIRDLIGLQIDNPVRVIAVDPSEGWSRDVSEDIAREIAFRHAGEVCHPKLIEFVEAHCGTLLANELTADAA